VGFFFRVHRFVCSQAAEVISQAAEEISRELPLSAPAREEFHELRATTN